ncbi:MAG: hypothetical protein WC022_02875 [Parcubacteria group bacterium]
MPKRQEAEMKIQRSSLAADRFLEIARFQELDRLGELYGALSPDVNSVIRKLSPVVSEIVWCPDNGKWRCVAGLFVDSGQVAVFFPWIVPPTCENGSKLQRPIEIGVAGNVRLESIVRLCQKISNIFEERVFS